MGSGAASVLGTITSRGSNAALVVVMAAALPLHEFGIYSALQAVAILTSAIAVFGFDIHLLRHSDSGPRRVNDRAYVAAKLGLSSIAGVALGAYIWATFGLTYVPLALLAVAAGTLAAVAETPESRLAVANKYSARAAAQAIPAAAVAVALLCVVRSGDHSASTLLILGTAALAVREGLRLALAQRIRISAIAQDDRAHHHRHSVVALVRSAAPYAAVAVLTYIYFRIDALMLGALSSPQELAEYNAQYNVLMGGTAISVALGALWLRMLVEEPKAIKRLVVVNAAIGLLLMMLLVVAAGPLTSVLYGEKYAASASLLRILALVLPISFVSSVALRYLYAKDAHKMVPWIVAIATAFNIAANFAAIPAAGAAGAAAVTIATEALLLLSFCAVALYVAGPHHRRGARRHACD